MSFGALDLVKFLQAIWPCIQQNYPSLISGVTQIVGGASLLAGALKASNIGQGSSGLMGMLMGLLNKIAINPIAK